MWVNCNIITSIRHTRVSTRFKAYFFVRLLFVNKPTAEQQLMLQCTQMLIGDRCWMLSCDLWVISIVKKRAAGLTAVLCKCHTFRIRVNFEIALNERVGLFVCDLLYWRSSSNGFPLVLVGVTIDNPLHGWGVGVGMETTADGGRVGVSYDDTLT